MPAKRPDHAPSVRLRPTNIFPIIERPCAEGADLRELWELASLPNASNEEAELLSYQENLLQSSDAFVWHLQGCASCVQSRTLWNRIPVFAIDSLTTAIRFRRTANEALAGNVAERDMVRPQPT
jgi:hypothetical protein